MEAASVCDLTRRTRNNHCRPIRSDANRSGPESEESLMKFVRGFLVATLAAWLSCAPLMAGVQYVGPVLATDLSDDGSVVVGNTQFAYETFRWTEGTGVVPLGRATAPVLGVGAGTPDVSADGTRVSATILDDSETAATQGVWTLGSGWQQIMPPTLPDGGILDQSYGSAWGLSGDGNTVSGLYWRPGQPGGLAHATGWTQSGGLVDLGSSGGSSRASAVNYDGSVIVGFDEHPMFGNWRATVWVDGVATHLQDNDAFSEGTACNPDGTIVVGQGWDGVNFSSNGAIWTFNGSSWDEQMMGVLPGTDPIFGGMSIANDVTADGSFVVGFNRFDFFGSATGFVWTPGGGMVSAADWLASIGVTLDPNQLIIDLPAVTPDGSKVLLSTFNLDTFNYESWVVTVPEPATSTWLFSALAGLACIAARRLRRHG